MKSVLFYFVPLIVYAMINNLVERLYWPYYVALLLAFLGFQLARLRYPKDAVPPIAKITQGIFYILTVAFIFRDQYLNPLMINVLLGITLVIVIVEIMQYRRKPSA
ncbi:hypothetical protein [Planococcus shenhongbingii]|uniref:YrdB family protein n=1 Tax=Planococcus shenhongbingii TaxID=3058398 RepID=A0ABT8N8F4_9BACL|nr:hypothetical protein [Planococcus sp. N017]MDN7243994.1 hypothetical protein [Planococcus sp. N017]